MAASPRLARGPHGKTEQTASGSPPGPELHSTCITCWPQHAASWAAAGLARYGLGFFFLFTWASTFQVTGLHVADGAMPRHDGWFPKEEGEIPGGCGSCFPTIFISRNLHPPPNPGSRDKPTCQEPTISCPTMMPCHTITHYYDY